MLKRVIEKKLIDSSIFAELVQFREIGLNVAVSTDIDRCALAIAADATQVKPKACSRKLKHYVSPAIAGGPTMVFSQGLRRFETATGGPL